VGYLPYSTERLPRVIDALAGLDVDLLYVQEFWLETHWEQLREAVAGHLPHAFRPPPLLEGLHGACGPDEVRPFVACARANCTGLEDEALAQCVVAACPTEALALAPACLNCLASHPVGSLDAIVGRCTGDDASARPRGTGAEGAAGRVAGLIAYGGSFGTGLLSRAPLEAPAVRVFASSVNARGAIHTRVRSGARELDTVDVIATHLSPGGAEQETQIGDLLRWIQERIGDRPALLLGDLNATPGSARFERFVRAGFHEPSQHDTRGTYAPAGLGTGHVSETGWRIDHVLVRGIELPSRTERIFDAPVALDVGGRRLPSTLSDHFGVLATLG
jgi:endonuclease/exonuclease/phosphatase family metal-dependent hydrolase